jgi:regulator of protease activity HflC (stomatin/prohibitin superfamily)
MFNNDRARARAITLRTGIPNIPKENTVLVATSFNGGSIATIAGIVVGGIVLIVLLASTFRTIEQAHVGVVTMFGKYRRMLPAGLHMLIPIAERIMRTIPVQNQTSSLEFNAITNDQAAVHFATTIIFAVTDHDPATIQNVAFKFITPAAFTTAMTSAVEASVREFVSQKLQAEVLGLRTEITEHAKHNLDEQLASWGYTLVDLQINDITFDAEVMASMSRVVTAKNSQTAATFEGQALLITRTKAAEANGAFIKISAENEAEAARLRGKGLADFRTELATGIAASGQLLLEGGIDPSILAFTMWTETIQQAAKEGTGNVIFLDGNVGTMEETMRRLTGLTKLPTPEEIDAAKKARVSAQTSTAPIGQSESPAVKDLTASIIQNS